MIDLAVHRLEEARLPNGVFLYGTDYKYMPELPANLERGAVGRTQPSNLALLLWNSKKVGKEQAIQGINLFWQDHDGLEMGRKRPWPHEAWSGTASTWGGSLPCTPPGTPRQR